MRPVKILIWLCECAGWSESSLGARGWLGEAKVSCILRHRGVQLILAYSWARPAVLVAGKGRGEYFYFACFLTFIHFSLSPLSLSFICYTISSISVLPFSGRRHKLTHKGWRVVKPQHNQSLGAHAKKYVFWRWGSYIVGGFVNLAVCLSVRPCVCLSVYVSLSASRYFFLLPHVLIFYRHIFLFSPYHFWNSSFYSFWQK